MLFVATLLGILLVGLALAGVVIAFQWRQTRRAVALISGLRADVNHLAGEFARHGTEGQQLETAVQQMIGGVHRRITSTHNVAITALDRLLYYTRRDKGLAKLGQLYERAIKKLQEKAEADAKAAAAADAPAETPSDVSESAAPAQPSESAAADDDMAKIAGSIGPAAGMPCG